MRLHGLRDQVVKLADLRIDSVQALQLQHQHFSVHGLRTSRQRVQLSENRHELSWMRVKLDPSLEQVNTVLTRFWKRP